MVSPYDVREYTESDQTAYLALHNRAFGSRWSLDHWRWRFLDNPLGITDLMGAFRDDGTCVASYGGVTFACGIDGEEGRAMNHADVCTDPELREGLGGSRRLIDITCQFFERSGRLVDLVWGFPEPGLLRTANRFAGVQIIRDVVWLVRDRADAIEAPSAIEVRPLARLDARVDALWAACAEKQRTALRRDAEYLNWRFVDHPTVDYEVLGAFDRKTGELRGLTVIRDGGYDASVLSLSEWCVPLDDAEAETALLAHVVGLAQKRQRPVLAWFPTPMIQFRRFQLEFGFTAMHAPYQQCGRWWSTRITRHWLHENWYQTMGDIDFF